MKVVGRHYRTGQAVEVELGERIVGVRELAGRTAAEPDLPWIAPGFVDLQINGYLGREFSSRTSRSTTSGRLRKNWPPSA